MTPSAQPPYKLFVTLACWLGLSTHVTCAADKAPNLGKAPLANVSRPECSTGRETSAAAILTTQVEKGSCPPRDTDAAQGKILQEAYWIAHPSETQPVAVVLKEGGIPAFCASSKDCAIGENWRTRVDLSEQQVRCVLDTLGGANVNGLAGLWYDRPQVTENGEFAPIGRIFRVSLAWDQAMALAKHPFVARIEPMPGAQDQWNGSAPPPIPCDCPELEKEPRFEVDVGVFASAGNIAVFKVSLTALPEPSILLEDTDEAAFQSYERSASSKRQLFCVQRTLDHVLLGQRSYGPQAETNVLGSLLMPPFGDIPMLHRAFSVALAPEEARELAKHPYVASLELLPSSGSETTGCPPDLDEPIEPPACDQEVEGIDGKISEQLLAAHADDCQEPYSVAVSVQGGAIYCELPECPSEPTTCPEREIWESHWRAKNLADQTCVRQLLGVLGATIDDDASISNKFYTRLSWSQIEAVASHPDVVSLSENEPACSTYVPPP